MKFIVIGNGGHSRVIQEMILSLGKGGIIAILDDRYESEQKLNGVIHAPIKYINGIIKQDMRIIVAIGNNVIRKKITNDLSFPSELYATVVHPSAVISPSANIGFGTVVMPNAVINAGVTIGEHCILNTGSIIEHDNRIGNFVHISPNTTLTGNVYVKEGAHIGASATVIPGKTVHEWATVGAGAIVIHDVEPTSKVVGIPAKPIISHRKEGII